jgi:dTDP-4-amino-4,6-dideoxygalactose transaminase
VIEDTALTLGAKLDNQYAGTIGDIGYFSTDRSKVINTGQGGMVSINNPRLKEKYEALYNDIEYFDERFTKGMARTFIINYLVHKPLFHKIGRYFYAIISRLKLLTYIPEEFIYKLPKNYPYPAKLSNILAKIGISQINKLNDNIDYRKSIAKQINSKLKIFDEECINTKENIFLRYSFLVKNRDSWEKKFRNKIDLGIWFKTPIAGLEWNELHKVHYKIESCPNAEYASKHILNIPTHSQIDIHDLDNLLSSLYKSNDTIKVVL